MLKTKKEYKKMLSSSNKQLFFSLKIPLKKKFWKIWKFQIANDKK
jgi:hypothetical protein